MLSSPNTDDVVDDVFTDVLWHENKQWRKAVFGSMFVFASLKILMWLLAKKDSVPWYIITAKKSMQNLDKVSSPYHPFSSADCTLHNLRVSRVGANSLTSASSTFVLTRINQRRAARYTKSQALQPCDHRKQQFSITAEGVKMPRTFP